MGNNIFNRSRNATVYITDDNEEKKTMKGLQKHLFNENEWITVKKFCQSKKINEKCLNLFVENFLTSNTSRLKNYRLLCSQLKQRFKPHSVLMQEIADIFIPPIYLRNYIGLDPPHSNQEVSFSRFIIMTYIFGAQHIVDTIYDFIAMLMQNQAIQLSASIFTYNFEKIIEILIDTIDNQQQPSISLQILKPLINRKNDDEITIEQIVLLGLKFPILFYKLSQFQKLFQRQFFGDQFWDERKLNNRYPAKIRLQEINLSEFKYDIHSSFDNKHNANKYTAQSIIYDAIYQSNYIFQLTYQKNSTFYTQRSNSNNNNKLSEEGYYRLKQIFGYKITAELIHDSGLECDSAIAIVNVLSTTTMNTMNNTTTNSTTTPTINPTRKSTNTNSNNIDSDNTIDNDNVDDMNNNNASLSLPSTTTVFEENGRFFTYDVATGEKKWIVQVTDVYGEVVKEYTSPGRRNKNTIGTNNNDDYDDNG